ncbi:Spo0E like sporulation regulatory protein [Paenibacillus illinoisensis]|uniref:Spo0E like sporulation regulatory protein n=1 Tax=Paenibacillus illinoisensis TaxID=59845 RepID=A0A2W0D4X2_9BACL|nr:Spo0E like sporulation regulatory protein [Paenibacillus illinoisensis]
MMTNIGIDNDGSEQPTDTAYSMGGSIVDKDTAIQEKIELKRAELHRASIRYGLQSEEALKISQELDVLLNEFNKSKK